MGSLDNLRPPFSAENQPSPEAKSRGQKKRHALETLRKEEAAAWETDRMRLLRAVASGKTAEQTAALYGIKDVKAVTNRMAVIARLFIRAMEGSVQAMKLLAAYNFSGDAERALSDDIEAVLRVEHFRCTEEAPEGEG